jgi:two-component system response regulator EvgA
MYTAIVVDASPILVNALSNILQTNSIKVLAGLTNVTSVIHGVREHKPDLLIMDVIFPSGNALDVLRRLDLSAGTKVLIFTSQDSQSFAFRCMALGCYGFLSKCAAQKDFISAVESILNGYYYAPLQVKAPQDLISTLSNQELVVTRELAKGVPNKEIARQLNLSEKTISTYKKRVLTKLNAKSIIDLSSMMEFRCVF